MRGFLAVLRREIVERRMLLAAAAFATLVPLAVPWVRNLSGSAASDARVVIALAASAAFAAGVAIGLGAMVLAPKIANRQIAFDFARPLSAFALWGGRLAAATVLAIVSASIVAIPAFIPGHSLVWRDLLGPSEVALLFIAGTVVLLALVHAIALVMRSAWIALDAVLGLAAAYGVSLALARLPLFMASAPFRLAAISFGAVTAVAVLAAGYASVARGRTDIRAAHRALSLTLWIPIGLAVAAVNVYASWVMAAGPNNLSPVSNVSPAPRGRWIVLGGAARGADAVFLYDTGSGRHARTSVVDWEWPVTSLDGSHAAWIEGRDHGGPLAIWTWNLADPAPSPVRTRLLLNGYASLVVLSDDGSRLATVEEGLLSIHDLASSRTLVSARVAHECGYPRGFFVGNDRFRIYCAGQPSASAQLEISELNIPSKELVKTGGLDTATGWLLLAADRSGERLIAVQVQTKQAWLLEGRTGRVLADLAPAASESGRWGGFLSDGRVVLTEASGGGRLLRVFSKDGVPSNEISFPGASRLALGGEAAPGKLIAAVGHGEDGAIDLVDVDTGQSRRVADHLYPAMRLAGFGNQPNLAPQVGSDATQLFVRSNRSLVLLDPFTGQRRVLLGEGRVR